MKSEDIAVAGLRGRLMRPDGAVRAGVLVLPSIFSLNRSTVERAEMLVAEGFAAWLWDLYPGEALPAKPPEALGMVKRYTDSVIDGLGQVVDHLLGPVGLGAVGTIGFCLGGRYNLLLGADNKRLGAVVSYYPSIEDPRLAQQTRDAVAEAAAIACPVQVVTAGHDHVTAPATRLRLQEILQARAAPTVMQSWPEADHSFLEPARPGPANQRAALGSWPQAMAFLRAALVG